MARIFMVGVLLLVVSYLLFQIISLSLDNLRYSGNYFWFLGLSRTKVSDQDKQRVLVSLKAFFREFEDQTLPREKQLSDFSIEKIDQLDQVRTGVAFRVFFSVKPTQLNSPYWLKINGTSNNDGWIKDKIATGKMFQADEQYYVISLNINSSTQISKQTK